MIYCVSTDSPLDATFLDYATMFAIFSVAVTALDLDMIERTLFFAAGTLTVFLGLDTEIHAERAKTRRTSPGTPRCNVFGGATEIELIVSFQHIRCHEPLDCADHVSIQRQGRKTSVLTGSYLRSTRS
jgi:hypothetical protein